MEGIINARDLADRTDGGENVDGVAWRTFIHGFVTQTAPPSSTTSLFTQLHCTPLFEEGTAEYSQVPCAYTVWYTDSSSDQQQLHRQLMTSIGGLREMVEPSSSLDLCRLSDKTTFSSVSCGTTTYCE